MNEENWIVCSFRNISLLEFVAESKNIHVKILADWTKFPFLVVVPSDSQYSDIELGMNETLICSEICIISSEKTEWCKISRNMDLISATLQNTRFF